MRLGKPRVEGDDRVQAVLMPDEGPTNKPPYTLDVIVMSIRESREVRCAVLVPIESHTNRLPVKVEIVARVGDFLTESLVVRIIFRYGYCRLRGFLFGVAASVHRSDCERFDQELKNSGHST